MRKAETQIETERKIHHPRPRPNPRAIPDPHQCDAEVALFEAAYAQLQERRDLKATPSLLGPARTMLAHFNSYEALHVKCFGDIHPVCPICCERWLYAVNNPVITKLVEMYPQETKDWSPLHKGFLRCPACPDVWSEYERNRTG